MADDMTDGGEPPGEPPEALLRDFLRDGRLIRLPAKFTQRGELLRYLAAPFHLDGPGGSGLALLVRQYHGHRG